MITTNASFDTEHAKLIKSPIYLIEFDGVSVKFVNQQTTDGAGQRKYVQSISGLSQSITPEKGKASISSVLIEISDYGNEITSIIASDDYQFHRKKTSIMVGYVGMAYADLITVYTGWVTGYSLSADGGKYKIEVTDPKKWLQRKIFRSSRTTSVILSGNPVNIALSILTSTGAGTNGSYDYLEEQNSVGIGQTFINIANMEAVRDSWFPGDSHYLKFEISSPIKAGEFLEKELWKILNCYPVIDGNGRYNIVPFKPPLSTSDSTQSFSQENIIGSPTWDANLDSLINEIEFQYDFDGSDFQTIDYYVNTDSLNNRGPGNDTMTIKSKGLHSDMSPASIAGRAIDIASRRQKSVFGRYANPPYMIKANSFFTRWISEAGDIVPFSHGRLPDMDTGTRGIESENVEIIKQVPNWKSGNVKTTFLATGFGKNTYGVIGTAGHNIGSAYITP